MCFEGDSSRLLRWLPLAMVCLWVSACSMRTPFLASVNLPVTGWDKQQPLVFNYPNTDTLSSRQMTVIVRFPTTFQFDRLNVEVTTFRPDNLFWCDTLSIPLTTTQGQWLDNRLISMINIEQPYRQGVHFTQQGTYRIRIKHLMPDSLLESLSAVGISIE